MTTAMQRAPFGVVFDLDGVLIDSHDLHRESWFLLADEIGKSLSLEQFKASFGMRNESCIPQVFHWTTPDDQENIAAWGERKEEHYRQLLADRSLAPLPGVVGLLDSLTSAGVPFSLGSSTSRKNIAACFASTGLDRYFGDRYTGAEDVVRGKPDPAVFLRAAGSISMEPVRCVVIEDAHVGIEAAQAAGMKSVAVTTTHARETFQETRPDRIVASLAELDAALLAELWAG